MIRVDLDVLLRGAAVDGELCEIPGYGPVPVSAVKDLTATGNAFFIAVLTKAHAVVAVSHLGRHPNAYQRSALDFLHPTCAVEGCSSRDGLEYDHRLDFAKTHFTAFDFLDKFVQTPPPTENRPRVGARRRPRQTGLRPPQRPPPPPPHPQRPATTRATPITTNSSSSSTGMPTRRTRLFAAHRYWTQRP